MNIRETTIDAGDAGTLRTMAEAFIPALDEAADQKYEDGDRHGAKLLRELANTWLEIIHLADVADADSAGY